MTKDDIIRKLKEVNRKQVARDTGLSYGYLCKIAYEEIDNPGSAQMDILRSHFQQRPQ